MRKWLIKIWRKLTTIKILFPMLKCIRFVAGTKLFNTMLDFIEVNITQTSFQNTKDYYHNNINRINHIIDNLADIKSQMVFQNIWLYRTTHNRIYINKIVDKEQYFDKDIVHLNDNELFIDCGAYKGDTIKKFIKLCRSNAFSIIAFEPDNHNFSVLKKKVKKQNNINIEVHNLGTWCFKTTFKFQSNTEEACMISPDGDVDIHVDTIDNIVGDRKVSFIKMDIEGAEMSSLLGSRKTIKNYHPKLAISIYHSNEDLLNIAEYILKEYPFYKIYIRHYSYFYADTVLYAISDNI